MDEVPVSTCKWTELPNIKYITSFSEIIKLNLNDLPFILFINGIQLKKVHKFVNLKLYIAIKVKDIKKRI